jgi:hypothetical protein
MYVAVFKVTKKTQTNLQNVNSIEIASLKRA